MDILQSLPEVYGLMITLGGHETTDRMLNIDKSLGTSHFENTSKSMYGIFTNLQSILKCHTLGYEFRQLLLPIPCGSRLEQEPTQVGRKDPLNYPNEEIEKWGATFQYLLQSMLYVVK